MIHNVLIRTANCNVFRNPSKTDILVMTDSPDTQIKDGATNLQCQDLVEVPQIMCIVWTKNQFVVSVHCCCLSLGQNHP
jgi:hypothetical protein